MSNQDDGATNRNFRFTHIRDIIPNTITKTVSILGFRTFWQHITPSYLIQTNNTAIPTAKDITIVPTDVDVPVSGKAAVIAEAHAIYFNRVLGCAPTFDPPPTVELFVDEMGFGNDKPV
jgi:hypothetical protein